jgi:magnesium transporter
MNFDEMPEIHWKYGYIFALAMMVFSSALTVWIFRRKNWL